MNVVRSTTTDPTTRQTAIRRWMTPAPHSVGRRQPISTALRLMRTYAVRHLPVLDDGKLMGVISERDVYFVESITGVDTSKTTVEEAMTQSVYCVDPEAPLAAVVAEMAQHRYGCTVVVEGAKVVGIFTTHDALEVLGERLRDLP